MGLDMYLEARQYISSYDENGKKIQESIGNIMSDVNGMNITNIVCEAMYWRKANAIHLWFVNNVQAGNDDCGNYYVRRNDLENLLSDINQVLDNPETASTIMPTSSGFFFGSVEYDDYYFENLRTTRDRLEELLSPKFNSWEFYYHSSW
jgi:hypothetical protein